MTDEKKEECVDTVFSIYRSKNVFPITYYNDEGVKKEIKQCIDKDITWDIDSGVLNLNFNQGQSLCRFMFPNMQEVECKGVKNNSPYYKFMDNHKLKRAIKFCLDHKSTVSPVVPTAIKDGLEMLGGNVATNYKAMNAKAIYQHFCKDGDVVFDFSSGFGGRMLGAMSLGLSYVGVEPCSETFDNLNNLGKKIREVNGAKFRVVKQGSEDKMPESWNGKIDFAFSSPPYFNLEVYSDEETQCYNKFRNLDEWFDGYVEPTIKNIFNLLKSGKYYAVNIADFKIGKKEVNYVDRWIQISKEIGFVFDRQIHMKLQTRRGGGHDDSNKKTKQEGIFIFKKP